MTCLAFVSKDILLQSKNKVARLAVQHVKNRKRMSVSWRRNRGASSVDSSFDCNGREI